MATPDSIAQLRSKLKDVEDLHELIQDDIYLALWLNVHLDNVKKAEAAIRDASQWWKAKDVPSVIKETIPLALTNKLPIFLDGISKDGLPVAYVRPTAMDIIGLLKEFKTPDIILHVIQVAYNGQSIALEANRERYDRLGDESLKTAWGHVAIIDMYSYSRKHVPPMKAVGTFIQCAREALKLPTSARNAYIIGVSTFILTLLKPIIPLLNALGINIKVYGTDEKTWGPDIYRLIDKKMLEEFRERSSIFENALDKNNRR